MYIDGINFLGDGVFLEAAAAVCCGVIVLLPSNHHADYMYVSLQSATTHIRS